MSASILEDTSWDSIPKKVRKSEPGQRIFSAIGVVDDIESEYKRLIKLGATEHQKPNNVGGEIVVATVKDPWGNVVGIIYNPEFKLP
jgi:lactoylglutathione lyase